MCLEGKNTIGALSFAIRCPTGPSTNTTLFWDMSSHPGLMPARYVSLTVGLLVCYGLTSVFRLRRVITKEAKPFRVKECNLVQTDLAWAYP